MIDLIAVRLVQGARRRVAEAEAAFADGTCLGGPLHGTNAGQRDGQSFPAFEPQQLAEWVPEATPETAAHLLQLVTYHRQQVAMMSEVRTVWVCEPRVAQDALDELNEAMKLLLDATAALAAMELPW